MSAPNLKEFEMYFGKEHPIVAPNLTNLDKAYGDSGDSKQKKELLEHALKTFEVQYGKEHPQVASVLYDLAIVHRKLEHYETAHSLAERSYHIYLKEYGEQHKDTKDADNLRKQCQVLVPSSSPQQTPALVFSAGTNETRFIDVNEEKLDVSQNSNRKNWCKKNCSIQ